MAVDKQNRRVKTGATPQERQPKLGGDPDSLDRETIAWQFRRIDQGHDRWGLGLSTRAKIWRRILQSLIAFEGLTWAEIKQQSGGRNHGTNHHSLMIDELAPAARRRLNELHLDQYDKVFSLRLGNTVRLYGVREGRVMQLVWYDPHHGSNSGVCPTQRN